MGSLEEFRQLLEASRRKLIRPLIDTVFPLDDLTLGLDRLERAAQQGKLVVEVIG